MPASLLLIDDDPAVLAAVGGYFERLGWRVRTARDGRTGLELYEREAADLVVTDLEMPGLGGLQVIDVLRARDPDAMILVLTGDASVSMAVQALQLGAENFLTKPVDFAHLDLAVARAREKAALRREARAARSARLDGAHPGALADGDFGPSAAMRHVGEQVATYAASSAHVLVAGETGTGKGWVARRVHAASARASAPFVELHCAGSSLAHLDAELFGVERTSPSGSRTVTRGLLDAAQGGTLYLDEVGGLAPELQPKLLGVLDTGRFRRVGGARELQADVRVVASTQADLAAAVRGGAFREDLYFRLAVLTLAMPPLRSRGAAEIAHLAQRMLDAARRRGGAPPIPVSDAALAALAAYPWPGNVRELRNVMERAAVLARAADRLDPGHLPSDFRPAPPAPPAADGLTLRAVERAHVLRVLHLCGNNKLRAARALGITRGTLYLRLAEYAADGADGFDGAPRAARRAARRR